MKKKWLLIITLSIIILITARFYYYKFSFSLFSEKQFHMATTMNIEIFERNYKEKQVKKAIQTAYSIIRETELSASWFEKDSDPSRIAKYAGITNVAIQKSTADMLEFAAFLSQKTDGLFDVTAGPLIRLWGFGPDKTNEIPTSSQILEAKKRVGINLVEIYTNAAGYSVRTTITNVQCDFSSLAPGKAADLVAEYLLNSGYSNFLIDCGGEIRTASKDKKIWKIGIQIPNSNAKNNEYLEDYIVCLKNGAISTSGSYRNFIEHNGKRLSHIIDTKSGYPTQSDVVSVSVIDNSMDEDICMKVDGWSTALMCLQYEQAINFAESNQLKCLIINNSGTVYQTKGWTLNNL